jgi:tetratricopeptide (TPR) repeat protein
MIEHNDAQVLLGLLSRATTVTPREYWRALPLGLRVQGLQHSLQSSEGASTRRLLLDALYGALRGFRPTVISAWPDEELLKYVGRITKPSTSLITHAVLGLYLHGDRSLQSSFFDAVGLTHDAGIARSGALGEPAATPQVTREAAKALLERFGLIPHVLGYALGLAVLFTNYWPTLSRDLEFIAHDLGVADTDPPTDPHERPEPVADTEVPSDDGGVNTLVSSRQRLSELDNALIGMSIQSAALGETAPSPAELATIVQQFIRVNPRRHQSLYHLGLVDALADRPARADLPVENDIRRRWYSAGWITGRARVHDDVGIAELYASGGVVRELGDGGPATEYAAPFVVTALRNREDHAAAARFLTPATFAVCDEGLAREVLRWTWLLLREERAAEAKPYLEVLEQGLFLRSETGQQTSTDLLPDARRRLAHCLRHEKNFEESKLRLRELLEEELPDAYRAMVLADIALMESRYDRLSAIPVPANKPAAEQVVEALQRSAEAFRSVAQIDVPERAHGEYPLGVLHLLRGEIADAFPLLERSAYAFAQNADRYRIGNLVKRAWFFCGLAGLQLDDEDVRTERFAELVQDGLAAGFQIPEHLIETVITHAAVKHEASAAGIVTAMISHGQQNALDLVAGFGIAGAERIVAQAMLQQYDGEQRHTADAAERLRRCLILARKASDTDTATASLSRLSDLAEARVGVDQFLDLLQSGEHVLGVWSRDEITATRIALLERSGRYPEAAVELQQLFYEVLGDRDYDCVDQADAIVSRIEGYGSPQAPLVSALRDRLQACRKVAADVLPESVDTTYKVTVVIVGGNETQRRYEASLCEWARQPDVNLDLRFIFSGWTSNWNRYVDEFDRLSSRVEGIVLLRFTRTEFGRAIRKRGEGRPQIGTWGHGEQSLKLAAMRVAQMVRENHARSLG